MHGSTLFNGNGSSTSHSTSTLLTRHGIPKGGMSRSEPRAVDAAPCKPNGGRTRVRPFAGPLRRFLEGDESVVATYYSTSYESAVSGRLHCLSVHSDKVNRRRLILNLACYDAYMITCLH
jgi:hypothetical protein